MPPRGRNGKKKKGRIIRPGMEDAFKQKFTDQMNDKLKGLGMTQLIPATANAAQTTAAQATDDDSSALNASQYTYYSESVNQNEETPGGDTMMQQTNVHNIQADLEAAQHEESKVVPNKNRQIFSSRASDSPTKIEFRAKTEAQISARQTNSTATNSGRRAENITNSANGGKSAAPKQKVAVLDQKSFDTPRLHQSSQNTNGSAGGQQIETITTGQGREDGALVEEEEEKVEAGQFFDDFDAAFGSDNDVPILELKKEGAKTKQQQAPPTPRQQPATAKVTTPAPVVEAEAPLKTTVEGSNEFFDDFDAAFGSDNDVPILVIKKEAGKQPAGTAPAQKPQEEEKKAKDAVVVSAAAPKQSTPPPTASAKNQRVAAVTKQESQNKQQPKAATRSNQATSITKTAPEPAGVKMLGPQLSDRGGGASSSSTSFNPAAKPPRPPSQNNNKSTPRQQQSPSPAAKQTTTFSIEQPVVNAAKPAASQQVATKQDKAPEAKPSPQPSAQDQTKKTARSPAAVEKLNDKGKDKMEESEDEESDEEETTPSSGGGRLLMFGAVCAMAAGAAFIYAKKNNIQVNEIFKRIQDRIQDSLAKK